MKNWFEILILMVLLLNAKLHAQDFNRKGLISQLEASKEVAFVINGNPFSYSDSLNIDIELNKIEKGKISEIRIIKNDGKISFQRNDVIFIEYAIELPEKIIKKNLSKIKSKFNDKYFGFSQHILVDSKDPVLYINGNKVHHMEIKEALSELQMDSIGYIYSSQNPQKAEYHGQNARNGVVVIWTKDNLAK